jgi:hypothetical protein
LLSNRAVVIVVPVSFVIRADHSAADTLAIFLSSTIGDYESFRCEVQDVLLKKAECACFLSEDWIGGYDATVQKCRDRVQQSGGFLLLLGYWYGSIPPGKDKSITHLEFEWALEKWKGDPYPKMAVLKPKPGKKADRKLRELAGRLLPTTQDERDLHAARLAKFHAQVDDKRTEWRTIQYYEDIHDLREYALVIGQNWRGFTALAAAKGALGAGTERESALREDQLGRLGRGAQHGAFKRLLSGLVAYPDEPAVAVLVQGDREEGQRAFVAYVLHSLLKNYGPKRKIGRLPPGTNTAEAVVAWVASTLGLSNVSGIDTPEVLAERVVDELRHQPLSFVIDRFGADYPGGVSAFQKTFWKPFWAKLKLLRSQQPAPNRLVAIITDYSGDARNGSDVVVDAKPGVKLDFSRLVQVSPLGPFTNDDLYDWFDELDVPDRPMGRRAQLAQRALTDEESNLFDGTPLHVFERLRSERLWPEGEEP